MGGRARVLDLGDQAVGAIASVGNDMAHTLPGSEQSVSHGLVVGLTGREREDERQAACVDHGV